MPVRVFFFFHLGGKSGREVSFRKERADTQKNSGPNGMGRRRWIQRFVFLGERFPVAYDRYFFRRIRIAKCRRCGN